MGIIRIKIFGGMKLIAIFQTHDLKDQKKSVSFILWQKNANNIREILSKIRNYVVKNACQ